MAQPYGWRKADLAANAAAFETLLDSCAAAVPTGALLVIVVCTPCGCLLGAVV